MTTCDFQTTGTVYFANQNAFPIDVSVGTLSKNIGARSHYEFSGVHADKKLPIEANNTNTLYNYKLYISLDVNQTVTVIANAYGLQKQ